MSAQGIDLRSHAAALRRRAGWLIAAAVVGLSAGTAYVWVEPPPLTSTTLVLLPTPALAQSSNSDVPTQVRVATSATSCEQAGQVLDPDLPAREVEKMVEVYGAHRPADPDRRNLDQRCRSGGALPGRGGRVRQLRPRHRSRSNDGGDGRSQEPEGGSAGPDRPDGEGDPGDEQAQEGASTPTRRKVEKKSDSLPACALSRPTSPCSSTRWMTRSLRAPSGARPAPARQ